MRYLFVQKDEEKNIIICGYVDLETWSFTQGSWTITKRIDNNDPTILNSKGYDFKWVVDSEKRWGVNHIYPIEKRYYYRIFEEIFG